MPFQTKPTDQTRLNSRKDVADWINDTQQFLKRIPVPGVLEHGATFRDDQYLGDGEGLFHFNQPGFVAFCQRLGCRQDILERLKTPGLPSQVLNDLLAQRAVREELADDEFVIDERNHSIIGLVSATYVTYSNFDLLTDIDMLINRLPKEEALEFKEAYGINTGLTVRYVSTHHHGTIKIRGSNGEDKTELGLEFTNSMVGVSAVRINYYLHRLLCTNGMMVAAAESVNRVFHAGDRMSFQKRLGRSFNEVLRNLGQLQEMLASLGAFNFDPESLGRNRNLSDQIFAVIPGSKQEISTAQDLHLRYPAKASSTEREEIRAAHDARLLALIPRHFGQPHSNRVFTTALRDGATLFDFLNVFTEYAKNQTPSLKLGIEERAGSLAKYIASTARQL